MTKTNPDVGLPPLPQANATSTPSATGLGSERARAEFIGALGAPIGAMAPLVAALARAQGAFHNVPFDRMNPHFKSKYASLAAILNMIRKPLADNGLSITHRREYQTGGDGTPLFVLVTTLHHTSGEMLESECPLPLGVKPQELGSAETYQKRYALCSLLNIAGDEDDDTNIAQSATPQAKITEAQCTELMDLIVEQAALLAGVSPTAYHDRFLVYASKLLKQELNSLADIPADKFQVAKAELMKKRSVA